MNKLKGSGLIILLIVLFTGQQLHAQRMGKQTVAMLQQSPAGSKIINFVNTVNSGEEATDEWIKENMSEALIKKAGIERLRGMVSTEIPENDGKLSLYVVERTDRFKFMVYAKGSKSEGWLKMEFMFEESQPYKIKGIGLDGVETGPEDADKPMKIG